MFCSINALKTVSSTFVQEAFKNEGIFLDTNDCFNFCGFNNLNSIFEEPSI